MRSTYAQNQLKQDVAAIETEAKINPKDPRLITEIDVCIRMAVADRIDTKLRGEIYTRYINTANL